MADNAMQVQTSVDINNLLATFLATQQQQVQQTETCPSKDSENNQADGRMQELDKEMFLEAVREFKCIWDTSDKNYKNRTMKVNAWKKLSEMFNQEVPFLQKVLKNLKDSLKKCLDKRRAKMKSGAAASSLPTCKYFEVMHFLIEKTSNKPTESNLNFDCLITSPSALDEAPTLDLSSPDTFSMQQDIASARFNFSSPPSNCSSVNSISSFVHSAEEPIKKRLKRKNSNEENQDDSFVQQLKHMDDKMFALIEQNKEEEKDEATSFCLSLIPVFKDFDKKTMRKAKIKIQQLLYDIQYGDD